MEAFERLIDLVPQDSVVLDVGAGGCEGENTSLYLLRRFKHYWGMNNKTTQDIERFCANNPMCMIDRDYWLEPLAEVGLLVLDMNIENNLRNWSNEGIEHAKKYLCKGGYMICYIMVTDNYGDKDTPAQLREHRDKWWVSWDISDIAKRLNTIQGFTLMALAREERRPEIYWSLLKYE